MSQPTGGPQGWQLALLTVAGAAVTGAALWISGLTVTGTVMGFQTASAADRLNEAVRSAKAGDVERAKSEIAGASHDLAAVQHMAAQPQIRAIALVPFAGGLRTDLDNVLAAANNIATAAGDGVSLLERAKGTPGSPPIFEGGRFDLKQIPAMAPEVASMNESLTAAQAELTAVQSIPGIGGLRDAALDKVQPLREAIATVDASIDELPDALGANGPRQYLVTVLNPAELFPTGGAPLSAMVLRFNKGQMTIPISGQISSEIFPAKNLQSLPWIKWRHVAGAPIYKTPTAPSFFVNSNLHPDFRVSGEEMARAWQAGGKGRIDGVISVDTTAVASVLAKTGPIAMLDGRELNADNLGQRLLIDSYTQVQTAQTVAERHTANNALMEQLSARLQTVQQLPAVVTALIDSGPGRHFQVYLRNSSLQKEVAVLGLAGGLSSTDDDYLSAFTISSPNKVAVFQERQIDKTVQLAADGSASVTEKISIHNGAPTSAAAGLQDVVPMGPHRPLGSGFGYNDTRAANQYLVYLPDKAVGPRMLVSGGVPGVAPGAPQIYRDVDGRRFIWSGSGADPGQTAVLEVSYSLPKGTFSSGNGGLEYRGTVDPQPMWQTPSLKLTVVGPAGYTATNAVGWQRQESSYIVAHPLDMTRQFVLSLIPS